ncbi:hypothetical protein [Cellulomonas oligotrophica]|nr:hypothetical protein [Cellulomonas oligotrophica]NYD86964.1 hypothetical protein [Cellulomonas oligotrophica]
MVTLLTPGTLPAREPARTAVAASRALRAWTPRQVRAAVLAGTVAALVVGLSTVLVPNPVFSREIATLAWNYPVWLVASALTGMLAATYVRPTSTPDPSDDEPVGTAGRLGMVGGLLTWFAVGCPVCNKIALLAIGYSGALTWFAPAQPYLAALAITLTAVALVWRLRGQVICPAPRRAARPRRDARAVRAAARPSPSPGRP